MKYWNDNEIQYIEYEEGGRVLPFKHPASIAESSSTFIEVEIIPGTEKMREYMDTDFELKEGLCVDVERRMRRNGKPGLFIEQFHVPLQNLGYDEEPTNDFSKFTRAMEIV